MNVILPTKDKYTTYDYEVGKERMEQTKEGKYSFEPFTDFVCPGMPFIVNFSDQMEYMKKHGGKAIPKIWVSVKDGSTTEVRRLSKEKTLEFATRSINQWGKDYAEKVLSASETGCLYFNILHHFGFFSDLLDEVKDNENPRSKKKSKVDSNQKE